MSILNNLNKEQRIAAEKIYGPSLILAGAGSGKTRTITYKIAYMVKEKNINPDNIVALTFTNKAANEMKERIIDLVGSESQKMCISTFHSFSVRLLRKYAEYLDFQKNFNIYDTDDSKSLIKKILNDLNYNGNLTPTKIYNKIAKNKEDYIDHIVFEKTVDMNIRENRIFAEIFKKYQEELKNNSCMDFSDILLNCKRLLENKEVLNKVQETFKYILVDEYQDTNNIQYDIVRLIAMKYRNICVVGDEDQSIYAFRGANINNILNFEKDYKDALIVKLEENYRSTPNILNIANSVIKNNSSSLGKKLWTKNNESKNVSVYSATSPYDEAKYIVDVIKTSKKSFSNFTVLYRFNAQSRILEQELNRYGIPCKVFGALSFYQRKEVKDLLAYLLMINNPYDIISFERAITNPKRKIGDKTIEKIVSIAKTNNISLLEALKYTNTPKLISFYNTITSICENLDNKKISDVLKDILEKVDYIEYVKSFENFEDRIYNIYELLGSIEELEKIDKNITLDEYLTMASLSSSNDNIDNQDFVKLMTIHSSKGLEFNTVFISGFENGIFPTFDNIKSPVELEEERRLCYVAITRAKKELHLVHSASRLFNGINEFNQKPSMFLYEMDRKYLNFLNNFNEEYKKTKLKTNIENFNPFKPELNKNKTKFYVGQIVTHNAYGKGRIKHIDEKSITLEFSAETKKISILFADRLLK